MQHRHQITSKQTHHSIISYLSYNKTQYNKFSFCIHNTYYILILYISTCRSVDKHTSCLFMFWHLLVVGAFCVNIVLITVHINSTVIVLYTVFLSNLMRSKTWWNTNATTPNIISLLSFLIYFQLNVYCIMTYDVILIFYENKN